ncbi:MAG: hypothetical protein ACRD4E_09895, partial [Bryobacteraceae bacterium]
MKFSFRLFLTLSLATVSFAQSQFSTDVLALSPLGFWPLNGDAKDATSNHNDGTLKNGVSFTGSVASLGTSAAPAAAFSSSLGQFIQMPTAGSAIFNLGTLHAFTAMAWIRTLGVRHMAIMSKIDQTAGWTFG